MEDWDEEDNDRGRKYVMFDRDQLEQMLTAFGGQLDWTEDELEDLILEYEMKDTAVIDLNMAWAGPALHILAGSCALAANLTFDSDQAVAITAFADYYHKQAMRADTGRMEIPTGEDGT